MGCNDGFISMFVGNIHLAVADISIQEILWEYQESRYIRPCQVWDMSSEWLMHQDCDIPRTIEVFCVS